MATYNIIYGKNSGKNCTTLVEARKQAIRLFTKSYTFGYHSIGITKDGVVIGHVTRTNSIFYVYQVCLSPGNPFKGYGPVTWINDEGKSLTTAEANYLYRVYGLDMRGVLKEFLW